MRLATAVLAAIVLAVSSAGADSGGTPPAVDLDHIRIEGHVATAGVVGGGTARLTLDASLQHTAQRLIARASPKAAGIVAVDARSGHVLVWAERRGGARQSILTSARAPAASVFKIATTVALMERGGVEPSSTVCFDGGSHGIERRHLEPPPDGVGSCAPFSLALGYSRNAVFAQLAVHRLARMDLLEVAERLGFNGNAPFDSKAPVGELAVPYGDLDFARTAAGFEHSRLSPLGGVHLALTIANGGRPVRIRVVRSAGDYSAPDHRETLPRVMSAESARRLTRMMEITTTRGTSADVFVSKRGVPYLGAIHVAGKTGTLRSSPKDPMSTWFLGFAPSTKPAIALCVLVQNGPVWRRRANELARDVLRAYFAGRHFRGVTRPLDR